MTDETSQHRVRSVKIKNGEPFGVSFRLLSPEEDEVLTKDSFRSRILEKLVKEKLIRYRRVIEMKYILRSRNAVKSAEQLFQLDAFKNAKLIYVHQSAGPVVYRILKAGKEIVMPMRGDKSCQFWHLLRTTDIPLKRLKALSRLKPLSNPVGNEPGELLDITTNVKIDVVILGSVCVSKDGRRIGDGKGLADLEFAVLKRMGAITDETTIVTAVHDIQVLDTLSSELFQKHDVPIDIIVTPSEVVFVKPRLDKPSTVVWQMLSERDVAASQLLQQLRQLDKENGVDVTLSVTVDVAEPTAVSGKPKKKTRQRRRQNDTQIDDNMQSNTVQATEATGKRKVSPKKQIDFSLKLSNIAKDVTRRDLKNALLERDVKPDQIKWVNHNKKWPTFCYIRFSKLRDENAPREEPVQVDSIMAKLHQLKVGKTTENEADFIIVEPANPISRIEVTDVTSV